MKDISWKAISILLVLIILTFAFASCAPVDENGKPITVIDARKYNSTLFRLVDSEAKVVCYFVDRWEGVSCLPCSETKLSCTNNEP